MTQPPPPQPPAWSQSPQPPAPGAWQQPPQQPPAGRPPGRRPNVWGIAAIAVAAILALSLPGQQLAFNVLVAQDGGVGTIGPVSNAFVTARFVLSLATIGLAIAGLVVRDRGRLLAAAALGIGASTLVAVSLSALIGLASFG